MPFAAETAAAREPFMRRALEQARRGLAAGGPPIGACLVRDGEVLAAAHNAVVQELDVTAHAEVQVLRLATAAARCLTLPGATLYVTVEPCAMCLTACAYAGLGEICYGAPIAALEALTGHEFTVAPAQLFAAAERAPAVIGDVMAGECAALLTEWSRQRHPAS